MRPDVTNNQIRFQFDSRWAAKLSAQQELEQEQQTNTILEQ